MRRRLKVVRLKKPVIPDDTQFIETLVWVLDLARSGKIKGYSAVFIVLYDETDRTVEMTCVPDDEERNGNTLRLLGGMRRMESNFMRRVWGDEPADTPVA